MARTTTPSRITIAYGAEAVLVDRVVTEAVAGIRALEPTAQRITIAANIDDGGTIIRDAGAPTLFGDATILVVTGMDTACEEVDLALRDLVAEPSDTAWLIVTHPGGVKGKNLMDALRKAGGVQTECAAIKKGKDTLDYLSKVVSSHKRSITQDALTVLYDSIGQDLRLLTGAISQLVSDVESDPITGEDARSYFGGVADVSGFVISDAVWDRRSVDALRSLRWAMQSSDSVAVATVSALAGGLRSIVRVAGVGAGASENDVAREAGVPPWKVKVLRRQWSGWSGDQRRLAAAAVALADADGALKGGVLDGSSLDPEQKRLELERLILTTAARH
jgi:DNA polymerase-3 subunit delta